MTTASDDLVTEARKLVNPVVLVGDFDDDEDEMTPTYPPPSKHDANKAVDMLAATIASLEELLKEAGEALGKIAAREFKCMPHQRFIAAQCIAEDLLTKLKDKGYV